MKEVNGNTCCGSSLFRDYYFDINMFVINKQMF